MSRLPGWDDEIGDAFFIGEDIIPNLSPKAIYRQVGLEKRTMKGKNTYNKLRLFLQELMSFNRRHQEK